MARRQSAQLDVEMPAEEPVESPAPVRRTRSAKPEPRSGWGRMRRIFFVVSIVLAVVAVVTVAYQTDQFLASNSHFVLAGTPQAHPGLVIRGRTHTPESALTAAFDADFGRSVYLIPLAERRRALMRIDWVRDAIVARRWPNTIEVTLTERTPVAFAMLPRAGASVPAVYDTALVDSEGVLLNPPPRAKFDLPVLYGLTREQPANGRRTRVKQTIELIRQVQAYAGQIGEINAADPDNLIITYTVQGGTVRLMLGSQSYMERLQGFLSRYPDIQRRLPNLHTFDVRLFPHIVAPGGASDAH